MLHSQTEELKAQLLHRRARLQEFVSEERSETQLSALVAREAQRLPHDLIKVCIDDHSKFRSVSPKVDDLTIMVLCKEG